MRMILAIIMLSPLLLFGYFMADMFKDGAEKGKIINDESDVFFGYLYMIVAIVSTFVIFYILFRILTGNF